jgi:nucleoside-diphosphate-sugar epimerase
MLRRPRGVSIMVPTLTIAVCGGSGRVGRSVVRELAQRGHRVLNLDRRPAPELPGEFFEVDLADRRQIEPILAGVDAVIQLAEMPNVNATLPAYELYVQNVRASTVVMQAAADLKVQRLIYTSSCQVYGCWDKPHVPPLHLPLDETHPARPQNAYALGKLANENYARLLAEQQGISAAVIRLPWVVSFEPGEELGRMLEAQTGFIDGLGAYIHHSDAARAFALAGENPRPGCEVYHFAADDIFSPRPLRERLAFNPGYPPLPPDWPDYRSPVLTHKAAEHFGWRASVSLR